MTVKIRGKDWRITRRATKSRADLDGCCYHDQRIIYIGKHLEGQALIDTIIHEVAHAWFPDLCEESVNDFATDAARVVNHLTIDTRNSGR